MERLAVAITDLVVERGDHSVIYINRPHHPITYSNNLYNILYQINLNLYTIDSMYRAVLVQLNYVMISNGTGFVMDGPIYLLRM